MHESYAMNVKQAAQVLGVETCLYRHFDSQNNLLYVGISINAIVRFSEHRASSKWSSQIATMTVERFSSHEEAYNAETQAIRLEHPKHNISKTGKGKIKLKPVTISMKPKMSLLEFFHSVRIKPKLKPYLEKSA